MGLCDLAMQRLGPSPEDMAALNGALALASEILVCCPPGHPGRWHGSKQLARIVIQFDRDWAADIEHLKDLLLCPTYDNITSAVSSAVAILDQIDADALSASQKHEVLRLHD
jgi:hypothetical protein